MSSNPYERLATLWQNFSVDEDVDDFVALASHMKGLNDQQCLGYFFSGLRDEIRVRICSHEAVDLYHSMAVAREIELKSQFLQSSKPHGRSSGDGGPQWASGIGLRVEAVTTYRPTSTLNTLSPKNKTKYLALSDPKPRDRSSLIPKALPSSSYSNTKIPQNHHRNRPTRQ